MKLLPLLSIVFVALLSSCTCSDDTDGQCLSFDVRQCSTDMFAEVVDESGTQSVRELQLQAYLESKGISVNSVTLVEDFHDGVCEACDVCPTGDRYYINIAEEDASKLDDLRLLNLEETDCNF